MANYFDSPDERGRIIVKEEVLLPEYMPEEPLHRHSELQIIADSIKPLLKRHQPINLFIHGTSGSGKTTCIKYLIKQLQEHSSAVLPVYVNCWENYTQLAVYNRIIEEMRLPLPRRGLASDEIFSKIVQYVKGYSKPILLILDDLDGLRNQELLYVVGRANDQGVLFGIIAIANKKELLASFELRIRSSLRFSELEFKPYSSEQIQSILQKRAELGLAPRTFDERLLRKIAESIESGSARMGLELLWKAAKEAEKKGAQKISIQSFEDSKENKEGFAPKLPEEELLILEILKNDECNSSDIYAKFIQKIPKTKRQIRNYLEVLEKMGLVESREVGEGILKMKAFRKKSL